MDGNGVAHYGRANRNLLPERAADGLRVVDEGDVARPGLGRRLANFVYRIEVKVAHVPASTLERDERILQPATATVLIFSVHRHLAGR